MITEPVNRLEPKIEEDVRRLLEDIHSIPMLTEQQERELAVRCAGGDEAAIDQMVSANMRLVVAIARRYYNGNVPLQDLIQEGAIGLMTAAKKFDYARGYRFSTYASKWIRQGVIRCAVINSSTVRIPVHMAASIRKVTQIQSRLRQTLDREPTLEEIGAECDLTADKVSQLLQLQPELISLDAPAGETDAIGTLVEDVRSPQPLQTLVSQELLEGIEAIMSKLTERQQRILRLHFGMEDGKCHSLEEIGNLLGISKERARQIEQQAMRKLRSLGKDMGLEDFLE
jgi:RNA polymerase primary sigma factor